MANVGVQHDRGAQAPLRWRELWLKEDWWVIWLGLGIVVVAYAFFVHGGSTATASFSRHRVCSAVGEPRQLMQRRRRQTRRRRDGDRRLIHAWRRTIRSGALQELQAFPQ